MKKILATLVAVSLCSIQAAPRVPDIKPVPIIEAPKEVKEVKLDSFNYVQGIVRLPMPVPELFIGHREKFKKMAFDFSLGMYSFFIESDVILNSKYLVYGEKNKYCGGGFQVIFGRFIDNYHAYFEPIAVIGHEQKTTFSEIELSCVLLSADGLSFQPSVTYKFGFKF